ncbi:putative phage protein (TIGR02218 family) [Sphingomonas kyeonggiensis]|uniref:DUF2163 domain-containing protein n=1 Tax=Sphingomonas kyeonggiensis TaxID=1268553 RepID=UPI00277E7645|nr:DUF2163 domain-containing protein [Sphingomonas kyeonggiensis]MDQ0248291.1 putative phage protein (TIGR02218 family) [Sphingomonas kyeonggiensis]
MSWLDGELTTLALCWRIERRDGVTIGLTAHDRDIMLDGLVHRAAPGMVPSAITRGAGTEPASMDVTGALTSDAISETDLLAGRWDGARVTIFACDWTDPANRVALGEGNIGAVETRDGMLTAELRGATAMLDRPVAEETSAECRAELGDRRCRVAMAGRRRFAMVTAIDDNVLTVDVGEPVPNAYGQGRLRWISGANSGLEARILSSSGTQLTLRRPPHFDAVGRVLLVEGCDRTLATCAGRFGNALNFRGEPYLPGIDLLTRYPGG